MPPIQAQVDYRLTDWGVLVLHWLAIAMIGHRLDSPYQRSARGRRRGQDRRRLSLAVRDILLLRLRAVLAWAHGNDARYREYRDRYRYMAESLGFEEHMKWAEAMP